MKGLGDRTSRHRAERQLEKDGQSTREPGHPGDQMLAREFGDGGGERESGQKDHDGGERHGLKRQGQDVCAREGGEKGGEKGGHRFKARAKMGEAARNHEENAGEPSDHGRGPDVGGPRLQDRGDARGSEGETEDRGL